VVVVEALTRHVPAGFARARTLARGNGPALILAGALLFALVRYDGFYNTFNVSAILSSTDLLCIGLMAIGLTFVISAGEIDLSVAGIAATTSIIAARVVPYGSWLSVLAALGAGLLVGLVNGALVAYLRLPSFIVTLAMLLAMRGSALILADRGRVPIDYSSPLVTFYNAKVGGLVPAPFLVVMVVFALGVVTYNRTSFGTHLLAVGGNLSAAELMGLRAERTRVAVFALTGALSGLAGVFLLAKTTTGNPLEGQGWELTAIAAVVLGGTLLTGGRGSVVSTMVGVALLAIVFQILNYENGQGIAINSYWQNVIRGLFVLAIVVVQARGLRSRSPVAAT
jgi:ribose transport system permease protein